MGEAKRQYQPVDLLEFKRRLLARTEPSPKSVEDPLSELARIIGGGGRIVPAGTAPPGEAVSNRPTAAEEQDARPHNTQVEPVQWPEWPPEEQSPRYDAVDQPFDDPIDLDEGAHDEWRSHMDRTTYSNENVLVASAEDARFRLHNRRHANVSLLVTAAAVAVAGVFTIMIFRPGVSTLSPADHRADTVAVAKTDPAVAPSTASVAGAQTSVDAGTQSLSTPPNPAGTAAAVVPAGASPPQPDSGMFLQPKQVRTVPVYGNGISAGPADVASGTAQAAPAPGLTFAQVVAAQTLPAPGSVPAPSTRSNAGATNAPNLDFASAEPPTAAARPATKSKADVAAAGTTYAAILASPTSESEARGLLSQLQKKYGEALDGHRLTFHRVKGAEGTVYEVRAAGLADDEAQTLCTKLSNAGTSCTVRSE